MMGLEPSSNDRQRARERGVSQLLMVVCYLFVYCAEFVLAGDVYPIISICMCVCGCSLCCAEFVLAGDLYPTIFVTIFITYIFITIITYK